MKDKPIPTDLCPIHREHAQKWRDNHYDWRHPAEWPAGMSTPKPKVAERLGDEWTRGSGVMDSRTSHAEREADFDQKNAAQMDLVASICRSGRSPQCTPDDHHVSDAA